MPYYKPSRHAKSFYQRLSEQHRDEVRGLLLTIAEARHFIEQGYPGKVDCCLRTGVKDTGVETRYDEIEKRYLEGKESDEL